MEPPLLPHHHHHETLTPTTLPPDSDTDNDNDSFVSATSERPVTADSPRTSRSVPKSASSRPPTSSSTTTAPPPPPPPPPPPHHDTPSSPRSPPAPPAPPAQKPPIIPPYWSPTLTQTGQSSSSASSPTNTTTLPGTSAAKNSNHNHNPHPHRPRSTSATSSSSAAHIAHAITLEDHTAPTSASGRACWAKRVAIRDWVVVRGGKDARNPLGAYVVWNVEVEMLDGGTLTLRKRYSDVYALRQQLLQSFPHASCPPSTPSSSSSPAIPPLPPKSVISRFRPAFLEKRRLGLEYFLNCVLLNPEFAGSVVVRGFVFD